MNVTIKPDEKRLRDIISREGVTGEAVRLFQEIIRDHYKEEGRKMPWRETDDPYRIVVSEVMLQQTSVERVMDKYEEFISLFPDFQTLASVPLQSVLSVWQGMGYNRRAIALQRIASAVVHEHRGSLPSSPELLQKLPGIGKATASSIAAFAFNMPTVFIETNIRRVFIHFFFHDREDVRDSEIYPLVEMTLDRSDPRQWYYGLMDYGSLFRKTRHNPNRRSAHYQPQSRFEGSRRQLRGQVLKAVVGRPGITASELLATLARDQEEIAPVLNQLISEGFIREEAAGYTVK
ncbi:MAG: A/G-specific adenine glycosylase [Nitrospirales bacterium]|nr:A/G-specific adenine glycosylase [Nitrospirales bacterium]